MKESAGLQPFTDFWVNCVINGQLSILCTFEPSYKYAAYLNDYHYDIYSTSLKVDLPVTYLEVNGMEDMTTKYIDTFLAYEPVRVRSEADFPKKIKGWIRQKKIVSVGVNLFEWIPNNFCWQKLQWSHFTLLDGFDEEREVFYVLDDDIQGYGYHEIPLDRFCQAVQNSTTEPEGFFITLPPQLPKFEYRMEDVLFYATRIKGELEGLQAESRWQFDESKNKFWVGIELFKMYLFQLTYRQTANALLFEALAEQGFIGEPTISKLMGKAAQLKRGWQILTRNTIQTFHLQSPKIKQNELHEAYQNLIRGEIEMWSELLG